LPVLTIWTKELRDTLRDRRTLWAMIIMPIVLMPAMILGVGYVAAQQEEKKAEHVGSVMVSGSENSPSLLKALRASRSITVVLGTEIEAEIRSESVDAGLKVPLGFDSEVQSEKPAELTIYRDSTRQLSDATAAKLGFVIRQFSNDVVSRRLGTRGIKTTILDVAQVKTHDVATQKEIGGFVLSMILPMFLVMWTIAGGMYTAIDVSAGEKERKTLEALLMTPATKLQIVSGKFLAVLTTSMVSVVLALGSLYLSFGAFMGKVTQEMQLTIEPLGLLLMLGVGVLLSCMFSALLLAVSILAKSFKEAQNYVTPLYLVSFLPIVFLNLVPDLHPPTLAFLLPAFNAMFLFKEVLMGDFVASHIALTFTSMSAAAAFAVAIAARQFGKESVLFRT
jgi:sodium transport system permease protein